jgi:transketolase
MIVADTVKGKGVSFMELNPEFHGKAPNAEETKLALAELEKTKNEIEKSSD